MPSNADRTGQPKKPKAYQATARVHFNHWLLLLIVGGLALTLIGSLYGMWFAYAMAGQTKAIMSSIPKEFNIVRGVNLKAMRPYKAQQVQTQVRKYYDSTAETIYWAATKELGMSHENTMSYFISASEGYAGKKLLFFLTEDRIDISKLGNGSVIDLEVPDMRNVKLVCPWDRLIVVAYGSEPQNSESYLNTVVANWNNPPEDNTYERSGWTGALATRGQLWSIMFIEGSLQGYMREAVTVIREDSGIEKLKSSMEAAKVFATWTSFGSQGTRLGAGLELADRNAVSALVTDMKEGPLGKADESELPNKMKNAIQFADPKQNGEFLQYLEYRQLSPCAYLITKIGDLDKAQASLDGFNNANRGTFNSGGGFGGPGGGGPGGPPGMGPRPPGR